MKLTWPTKKLREICIENVKSPFKVEDASNSGEYPFFTSGEKVLSHDKYLVDGENIFLATGGYATVKYYNGKASYSTDTWSLKVKNALAKFVFYQILERLKYIDEVLFRGSGLRHLQKREFLDLEIPLPPLPIQQKIVKILDTIQEAIDIQDKIIKKTKELKKSLMAELFKYGGPSFRRGRKLKQTQIGEIPEDWEVVRLGEVCYTATGGTPSRSKEEYFNGNILWVKSGEIDDNIIFDTEEKITEEALNKSSARIFPKNTLLIAMYGATAGKTALLGKEASINQAVCAILPKSQKINIIFLRYFIIQFREKLLSERYGGAQPNLNQFIIQNFKITLPPLPEQQEIAEILQTVDQKIDIERRKKELYEELFKTVLNKIMNQEIDVESVDF
jgi:type I restriction enzyme S subunit